MEIGTNFIGTYNCVIVSYFEGLKMMDFTGFNSPKIAKGFRVRGSIGIWKIKKLK